MHGDRHGHLCGNAALHRLLKNDNAISCSPLAVVSGNFPHRRGGKESGAVCAVVYMGALDY
jgi:hypothetical protein